MKILYNKFLHIFYFNAKRKFVENTGNANITPFTVIIFIENVPNDIYLRRKLNFVRGENAHAQN